MGLLGDGWSDPQSNAIMQLAGGLLSGNFGQGAAAYGNTMAGAKDAALKRQYLQSQMDDHASQIEARKLAGVKDARQQALIESMFGGSGASSVPAGNATGTPSAPGGASPARAPGLLDLARQYGIPEQAIQADMVFNGGKKISELLAKHGAPDMQVTNGYAYDKNKVGPGYLPSLSTSQDGKTSMVQIGPDGLPVVSAPRGSLETFGSYQDAQAARKPIKVFNPSTQREEYTNEGAVVGGQQPQVRTGNPMIDAVIQTESGGNPNAVSPKGARGNMQVLDGTNSDPGFGVTPARDGSAAERTRVGQDYLGKMQERYKDPALAAIAYNWGPGNTDMWLKGGGDFKKLPAETQSYVAQVLTRNGVNAQAPQSGNYAAGPSSDETAQAKAKETRLVGTASADVVRDTSKQKEGKLYGQLTAGLDRAINLLGQSPTASGAGSWVDGAANFVGKSTKGADVASQLETVSGWLTANVPRMEGPQSDKDVQSYRIMAAEVGDRTKPVSQRLAAAKELQGLQAKYAELNGGTANTGGTTGSRDEPAQPAKTQPPPQAMKGLVRGGYKFKGGDPSNQSNWEKQ